ncbi:Putative sensory transduction regulator [Halopseudomonas litoralis]|uniref:Putative sensory transduction regulator n=1 Tax=Halopseudomonas litoralis TaxID=797277 RepID=A0A1H1Q8X5_9GAMM|nr:YbjN domain-containing protein [Halopseudomonas litoralis]SDS19359.1 Putative sensory transduction regulator [Halopseudomonas litoralis]
MSNESALIESMDIAKLSEMLQNAGYRSTEMEQNGLVQLLSASQGIGFVLRPGNPGQEPGRVVDFTLSCALQIQNGLPADLVTEWNRTKRFSRLTVQGEFLVLAKDVVVAGGVSERYLRANMELWDRLLLDYVLYLRNFNRDNAQAPVSVPSVESEQADSEQTDTNVSTEQQA